MMEILETKKGLGKLIALVLIILAIYLGLLSLAKIGEIRAGSQFANINNISVSGKGDVTSFANIAQVNFSAIEVAKTVAEAQKMVALKVNKSIDYLNQSGVQEKDIKTENYSIYPKYEYREEQIVKPVLVGYEVSQSVRVKIRKIDEVGEILEGLGNLNIFNLSGPNFDIEDKELLQAEARNKAIQNAKEKAGRLAKDLGVRLGKIVSFNEGGEFGYDRYLANSEKLSFSPDGESTPNIPTGEEKIVSNVTIIYQIR